MEGDVPEDTVLAWCARHRWTVLAVYAALAAFAWTRLRLIPLDAIPDLSDPQVILFTELPGRPPALVEDQVTYPLAAGLLAAPRVTAVRGYSMLGMSFVYVLFEEGTDLYWARSRVVEYLGSIRSRLPAEASPVLGPDASGVGWVYQYALVDRRNQRDLGELRSIQDFQLRYALESVPGVSQVAALGGYERQYRIGLDPDRLRAYGLTVGDVTSAVRASNDDAGGRTLELSGREYAIRGRGYLAGVASLDEVTLRSSAGVPVRLGDVATIELGGEAAREVTPAIFF
ncbi:MAG: efflux RND transporter permease subunit, partial [Myxococcales bacterium]